MLGRIKMQSRNVLKRLHTRFSSFGCINFYPHRPIRILPHHHYRTSKRFGVISFGDLYDSRTFPVSAVETIAREISAIHSYLEDIRNTASAQLMGSRQAYVFYGKEPPSGECVDQIIKLVDFIAKEQRLDGNISNASTYSGQAVRYLSIGGSYSRAVDYIDSAVDSLKKFIEDMEREVVVKEGDNPAVFKFVFLTKDCHKYYGKSYEDIISKLIYVYVIAHDNVRNWDLVRKSIPSWALP